jgi:hypothetical protein
LPEVAAQVSKQLLDMLHLQSQNDLADPHIFMQLINTILADLSHDQQRARGVEPEQVLAKHFERARRTNFGLSRRND